MMSLSRSARRLPATALSLSLFVLLSGVACVAAPQKPVASAPAVPASPAPQVVAVYPVAPDIVAVAIQAGTVQPGHYEPYKAEQGDTTRKDGKATILKRGGKEIGWIIGAKQDGLVYFEHLVGNPLPDAPTESPASYTLSSDGSEAIHPTTIWRKSKPNDWAQPGYDFAMYHVVYLKLPTPLDPGKRYTLRFAPEMTVQPSAMAMATDGSARSEAVHVSQIGFRPDDPVKQGFLSIWLGTGGGYEYATLPKFRVVDTVTGKTMLSGTAELAKAKDGTEKMWVSKPENYPMTAVYRMDFSTLSAPGKYKVVVDDVGSSYPFPIGTDVWRTAFVTQMRGLLNERGGVELGPPYTTFRKPRDFYPGADTQVFQSNYNVVDGGKSEAFVELEKLNTGKPVPEAWGGYHDAGDWNPRRVTHMKVTLAHLELLELFPTYFEGVKLRIPAKPNVPDVLTEALFELDLFRRLQKPDGGVPFEIETNGDPIAGELSWKQSMNAYVSAPDPWASWYYASVAGKAAKLLEKYDPKTAAIYRASAIKAMEWAEKDRDRRKADGTFAKITWEARDARNLAAVTLYDLTGEKRWDDVFRQETVLTTEGKSLFNWGDAVQRDAAFLYARLPASRNPDPVMKARAITGMKQQAEAMLNYASGNAFHLTTLAPGRPLSLSFWSTPDAVELCRAHFLTGDKRYLAGAVQACQFAAGGNPNNITYTTGVGANPIQHPLHLDSRETGQPAPEGLTTFGNFDFRNGADQEWAMWPMKFHLGHLCKPSAYDWPLPEAYFDIYMYPATNEYTVDTWAPNVYVWGYLAARK